MVSIRIILITLEEQLVLLETLNTRFRSGPSPERKMLLSSRLSLYGSLVLLGSEQPFFICIIYEDALEIYFMHKDDEACDILVLYFPG